LGKELQKRLSSGIEHAETHCVKHVYKLWLNC
jgi:hypothetical protein